MKLRVRKISAKSFILIFSTINVAAGFIMGLIVSLMSLLTGDDQSFGGMGAMAVILFPLINGILGVFTAVFVSTLYNFLSDLVGPLVLEVEEDKDTL